MEERQEHIDELISLFLSQGLNQKEQEVLDAWVAESEENQKYFMQHQEVWFSALQNNISSRYNEEKAFDVFKERVSKRESEKTRRKNITWRSIYKYAAAILILGMVSYFSFRGGESRLKNALAEVRIEAPMGSQTRLHLPDGTLVVLNAGSYITYSQDFGIETRMVKLQGEGYFEVAHNANKPFHVQTKDLQVRVLGTKFNFCDYPEDKEVVVSLIEGKVALNNQITQEAELILHPNERVVLDKQDGIMKKGSIEAVTDMQWTGGRLIFDETPLSEVARILERSYGVRINFANDSLKNFRFYGNFSRPEQSLQDILEALSATGKAHYTLKNNDIVLY